MERSEWLSKLKVGDKVAVQTCPCSGTDEYFSAVITKVTKAQVETDFHAGRFRLSDGRQASKPASPYDPRDSIEELTPEVIAEINKRILRNRMRVHFDTLIKNSKALSLSDLREILEVTKPIYEVLKEAKSDASH